MHENKIIALIPARSGSKGLLEKNIQPLGDRPLIAWSIEAALSCELIHRTVVSTDSQKFADVARQWGADVPFLRPEYLADDNARVEDSLIHALNWIEENEGVEYDVLVLLQVTDVFRNRNIVRDVTQALIEDPKLDSAFAVKPDFKNYWKRVDDAHVRLENHDYVPRQIRQPLYREDTGMALATRVPVIKSGRRIGDSVKLIPHENPGDFVDIHTEFDLWLANELLDRRGIIPNQSE